MTQDYKKAYAWFNIAATNGNEEAIKLRDIVAKKMDAESLSEAQALSQRYFEIYNQ